MRFTPSALWLHCCLLNPMICRSSEVLRPTFWQTSFLLIITVFLWWWLKSIWINKRVLKKLKNLRHGVQTHLLQQEATVLFSSWAEYSAHSPRCLHLAISLQYFSCLSFPLFYLCSMSFNYIYSCMSWLIYSMNNLIRCCCWDSFLYGAPNLYSWPQMHIWRCVMMEESCPTMGRLQRE